MAVKSAGEEGRRIKAVGTGHSFTGCAVADQVQVRLDGLSSIEVRDGGQQRGR